MQFPITASGTDVSTGKPLLLMPDQDHPDTMNQIAWSLMYLLTSQGIDGVVFDPTNPTSYNRLAAAIQAMINATTNALAAKLAPYGSVIWCPSRAIIQPEYTPADGQLVTRASCPSLVAQLPNLPAVSDSTWTGTATKRASYSTGDGSTTIRLPDYNGQYGSDIALFLRGDGGNAAAAGVIQDDKNASHRHLMFQNALGGSPSLTSADNVAVELAASTNVDYVMRNAAGYGDADVGLTGASGGNESRPKNVAGCWAIRTGGAATP